MKVVVQRSEFAPDRQVVDVIVTLPDRRAGWGAELRAEGPTPSVTSRQPCIANGKLDAVVRFYPFLFPGDYTLVVRLLPPETATPSLPRQKRPVLESAEIGRVSVPPLDDKLAADWMHAETKDLLPAASRALMPLCVDLRGRPCFWPLQGSLPCRVAVLSVPKAGTYLVTKLLAQIGIVSCNVHVGRAVVNDYRASRQMPAPVQQHLDIAFSARLVLPGQSVASHMKRQLATEVLLHPFRKIFVYRDLRAALVSAFRTDVRRIKRHIAASGSGKPGAARAIADSAEGFAAWLARGDLERMQKQYEVVAYWYDHPEVCRVSFEEIMGDAGPEQQGRIVAAIAAHCEAKVSEAQTKAFLESSVGAVTLTYSGARSDVGQYWTPQAEELFQQAGLGKLNQSLGYDAA